MIKTLRYFLLSLSLITNSTFAELPSSAFENLVEYRWENNAAICVIGIDKRGENFKLGGQGFKPNEVLNLKSISGEEELNFSLTTDRNGSFQAGISPAIIGKDGGVAKITIKRKNNSTLGTLTYYWGNQYGKQNKSTKPRI